MNIKSDQLCCYLEGIKVPIKSILTQTKRNELPIALIEIVAADQIIPKMWANAFIQVTCIEELGGRRQEKLLFQGLCKGLEISEINGLLLVRAISLWSSLNFNTTLDYTAPKKYSVFNLEGEDAKIFIGDENVVNIVPPSSKISYTIANRYFFLPEEIRDWPIEQLEFNEKMTMEYIAQHTPFAERFAYSLFEDLSYGNFLLSKAYVERFNLLSKSDERISSKNFETKRSEEISGKEKIKLDTGRVGLKYKWVRVNKNNRKGDMPPIEGLKRYGGETKYHYKNISEKMKEAISSAEKKWKAGLNLNCTIDDILTAFQNFFGAVDLDPNIGGALIQHESAGWNHDIEDYMHSNHVGWGQFAATTWPLQAPPGKSDLKYRTDILASVYAVAHYLGEILNTQTVKNDGRDPLEQAVEDYYYAGSGKETYWETHILPTYNSWMK